MAVIFHYCILNKGNKENKRKCGFANLGSHVPGYVQGRGRGESLFLLFTVDEAIWVTVLKFTSFLN